VRTRGLPNAHEGAPLLGGAITSRPGRSARTQPELPISSAPTRIGRCSRSSEAPCPTPQCDAFPSTPPERPTRARSRDHAASGKSVAKLRGAVRYGRSAPRYLKEQTPGGFTAPGVCRFEQQLEESLHTEPPLGVCHNAHSALTEQRAEPGVVDWEWRDSRASSDSSESCDAISGVVCLETSIGDGRAVTRPKARAAIHA
jgi:hypothetical protein